MRSIVWSYRDIFGIHAISRCTTDLEVRLPSLAAGAASQTRGSAIIERPTRRSVSVEMLYKQRMQTPVSARGAFSAAATFCSATCIILYTHRCSRLNYRTASMRCRACHQQTFIQPTLLMSTGPVTVIINLDYHQSCWWHHVLLRQSTSW